MSGSRVEIRRARDEAQLWGVAEVSRQMGRGDVEGEVRELAAVLREEPDRMSVHIAWVDGVAAACGRVYFGPGEVAELAGGRTRTTHRNRGLFTALVAARLREAVARGCSVVLVDALPTSEPILTRRGFTAVTTTRPFVWEPPVAGVQG